MFIEMALGLRALNNWKIGSWVVWGLLIGVAQFFSVARAHVILDSPNSAVTLDGGSELTIQWHVHIMHNTQNWDLWYSEESNKGSWQKIVLDLPKGTITEGAMHSFDWTLPNLDIPAVWVRVGQDNAGMDYYDVSDTSFSIEAMLGGGDFTGDGNVNAEDLVAWQQGFGSSSAAPADGDADLDADVDGADFLAWQSEFIGTNTALVAQPVPEPAATALLLIGMIFVLWQRR